MKWTVYAPVIIPTLCRYEHFKRCIESLSRCTGAEYTEVFIGLDYPLKESHIEGYHKICDLIPTIHGFKNIVVYKRSCNFGASQNTKDLFEQVSKLYDRFIYSEDDNEFAPNFLEYMNAGLERYKNDPKVLYICGCTMPWDADYSNCIITYPYNAFPAKDYNALGTGSWFSKPKETGLTKDKVLHSYWLTYKSFRYGYCMAINRMLFQLHKKSQLNDVCRRLFCAFNNKYCIFPRVSKVRNWGYDGTGLNSDNNPKWIDVIELDTSSEFVLDEFEIKDYKEINIFLRQMYDVPPTYPRARWYTATAYIFYRLTNKRIEDVREIRRRINNYIKNFWRE